MRLAGKTALVTGGGSGFGAGIARKFIAEGAQVVIADINLAAAEAISEKLGTSTYAAHVDVADLGSVKALARQAEKDVGAVDIVINNAGVTHLPTPLDEVSEEDFDRVFSVNCKSVYLTAKTFVPAMKARGAGAILNIASGGTATQPELVQQLERLDEHGDQNHGG